MARAVISPRRVGVASATMEAVRNSAGVQIRLGVDGRELELLSAALGATDHGIMLTSLDHTTLAVNERFGEIWGVDPAAVVRCDADQVRSMVAHRIIDFDAWGADLDSVYSEPEMAVESVLPLVNPPLMVRRYTGPFYDATGRLAGRIWTFLDVSAEELRRRRLALLQDASLLSDPTPQVVYGRLVDEVASLYGTICLLSIQEDTTMRFHAIGAPEGHPIFGVPGNNLEDSFCKFCVSQGPIIIQDARNEPDKSGMLPVQHGFTRYAGVPIHAPNGNQIGTLCIMDGSSDERLDSEDLTLLGLIAMRISSELERERQIADLQSDLAEAKSKAIQNEKLAVAGTLSATIAHDIRNILAALRLEVTNAATEPSERLRRVAGHMDRFSLLSHRLLSYAKPRRLVREQVNVSDSLGRVLGLMSRHLEIGRFHLEASIRHDLPLVSADPARLDHLFVNLILNALQAMGSEGTLSIETWAADGRVMVAIRDTGPGMTETDLTGLFRPFASQKQDGFGLGLYSAQQIAKECGGELRVESVHGQGTSFVLEVPPA